jgi:hypothetical protein
MSCMGRFSNRPHILAYFDGFPIFDDGADGNSSVACTNRPRDDPLAMSMARRLSTVGSMGVVEDERGLGTAPKPVKRY